VALVKLKKPDIVFTDIRMPVMSGIEATKEIKSFDSSIGVAAFTSFNEDHFIMKMLDAGADGCVQKSSGPAELLLAAKAICAGEKYYCNATSNRLKYLLAQKKESGNEAKPEELFNYSELRVLALLCEELSTKEIAERTKLTFNSVQTYRARIMEKINSRNTVGIVIYAIKHGLFKP